MALAPPVPGQPDPGPKQQSEAEVQQLVKDLASPSFPTREQATRKLDNLGEPVLPALRKGIGSPDAEVRRRCALLVRRIEGRCGEAEIEKWRKKNMPDFLERLATDKEFATPQRLRELWAFVEFIADRASKVSGRRFRAPPLKVTKLPITRKPYAVIVDKISLVRDLRYTLDNNFGHVKNRAALHSALSVAGSPPGRRGTIAGLDIHGSVVFVEGDALYCTYIQNSIVVCQGNLPSTSIIKNSIVLATGRLAGIGSAENSFLEVGEIGGGTRSTNNVYMNLKGNTKITVSRNDLFPVGPSLLTALRRAQ